MTYLKKLAEGAFKSTAAIAVSPLNVGGKAAAMADTSAEKERQNRDSNVERSLLKSKRKVAVEEKRLAKAKKNASDQQRKTEIRINNNAVKVQKAHQKALQKMGDLEQKESEEGETEEGGTEENQDGGGYTTRKTRRSRRKTRRSTRRKSRRSRRKTRRSTRRKSRRRKIRTKRLRQ